MQQNMDPTKSSVQSSSIDVLDNNVYLFYPITRFEMSLKYVEDNILNKLMGFTIIDLINNHLTDWIPEELKESILTMNIKGAKNNVWEDDDSIISSDLHKHLFRILQPDKSLARKSNDVFTGHRPLKINEKCIKLLNGKFKEKGNGLEIQVNQRSTLRSGSSSRWLPFKIQNIRLFLFGTGVGIVVVKIFFRDKERGTVTLTAQDITEGLYAVIRVGKERKELRWVDYYPDKKLYFTDLIKRLLSPVDIKYMNEEDEIEQSNQNIIKAEWNRIFSYVVLKINQSHSSEPYLKERNELAYRLSGRYTTDYQISERIMKETIYCPFETVIHVIQLEGGATIVESNNEVQYLNNYIHDSFRKAYLPLVILAYQEYLTLIKMNQEQEQFMDLDFNKPNDMNILDLKKYRNDLLDFRLNYRFSHASRISMHNNYYDRWRNAFSLDKMLAETSQDVDEVEKYLNYEQDKNNQRRIQVISSFQTICGIIFAVLLFAVGFFGMNVFDGGTKWLDLLPYAGGFIAVGLIAAFIYLIIVWNVIYKKDK